MNSVGFDYIDVDWSQIQIDRSERRYWQVRKKMEKFMAKNQQDEQGIIGREPVEEVKPTPRVPRRPAEPAPESKTVLDHRAKLAEMDRKRGF